MRRLALLLAGSVCLAAGLISPAAAAPKEETYTIQTRDGLVYVEVVRPVAEDGSDLAVPAILTYSPYSILGRNGDASRWVPQGYARVWADVVGTGNSGGCYDYGGNRERRSGYDLVEWIADQPWSTGKVGMIGGSYNGTTATAAATLRPPHLKTIVPEAAISRWYEYAYSGGIRYLANNENPADEGFDTPLAFDFGFAIPPPLDVTDPDWGEKVASTVTPCDEVEHTLHGYDFDTPDYDRFWRERDYIRHAGEIRIPVLVAHNWGDWNVKQEEAVNLYRALDSSRDRMLYMGTRYEGHGRPGGAYAETVDAWFARYLKGERNGVRSRPNVTSEMSDYDGATRWWSGAWPNTRAVRLFAQFRPGPEYGWRLLGRHPWQTGPSPVASFTTTGTNSEAGANQNPRANAQWLWFETPKLARDVRIFGSVRVRIRSSVDRRWITFTPTIVDVDPAHRIKGPGELIATDERGLISATRGWLDSRYRKSLADRVPVRPGSPFSLTVVEKPQDYTFREGHIIGLAIQTEITEWNVPKAYPGCSGASCAVVRVHWAGGGTKVTLPVVNGPRRAGILFDR